MRHIILFILNSFFLLPIVNICSANEYLQLENDFIKTPYEINLKIVSSKAGNDIESNVFINTLRARYYFFSGNISASKNAFNTVNQDVYQMPLSWASGYWFLYRSVFAIEEGQLDEAKRLIRLARRTFTNLKDSIMLVRVQAFEAVILIWREEYSEALKLIQSAQSYLDRYPVDHVTRVAVIDAFAFYNTTLKYYQEAIIHAEHAHEIALKNKNILDIVPIKYNLCLSLLRSKAIEKSRKCYGTIQLMAEKYSLDRYHFLAFSGLAKAEMLDRNYNKAIELFTAAKNIAPNAITNPAHLIVLHNSLAESLVELKMYHDAEMNLELSLKYLNNYKSILNNRYKRQTYKLKALVLESQNKLQESIQVLKKYITIVEEAEKETKRAFEKDSESFFEAEQHKLRLTLSNQKIKAQSENLAELAKEEQLSRAFMILAILVSFGLLVFVYIQRKANKANLKFAYKDPITDLFNRRYFQEQLQKCYQRHESFVLAILDLDDFKKINDNLGPDFGDEMLMNFSHLIKAFFRDDSDIICRYEGDEFCIISTQMSAKQLTERLNKLNQQMTEKLIYQGGALSFSAGIANNENYKPEELIKSASLMLQDAKSSGKKKIVTQETVTS